jgi:hypothetical protein
MVFSLWLWPTTKSTATKNIHQTLGILMAMQKQQCNARRIAQWRHSMAGNTPQGPIVLYHFVIKKYKFVTYKFVTFNFL